jgi:universal stress protein A
MIVIVSYGRHGIQRALLGSVAEAVMRHAPCPVIVTQARE